MSDRRIIGRVLASYACASVANGLPWPLLLVLVWQEYGDGPGGAWAVGLAGAARMLPYVLLSWAVGSLGDHVRRDRLVLATLVLRVLFLSAGAVAVAEDAVLVAVVAASLAITAGTPAYPAIAAALPRLAGSDRESATELLVTIEVSAWVVGPALGGLLLAPATRPWTLVVAVGLALLALVLIRGARIPSPLNRAPDAVAGVLRTVLQCGPTRGALGLAGLLNLVLASTGVVLLPLSHDAWGLGDAGFGVATACLGFGALGAPLWRLWRATRTHGLVLLALALLVVAATPVPWVALPLLGLAGATGVVVESRLTQTLQDAVPDHYRAGALGLADCVMVGGALVGTLVAPALARFAGARPALLVVALAALLPLLAVRLVPYRWPRTPYDATNERTAARPDPRGAPAVGAARVG
jgi:MFS family permease